MSCSPAWGFASSENELKHKLESPSFPEYISLSSFILEKMLSENISPNVVKKKKKYADSLLKMKMFPNLKVKTYLHKTLNKSKCVVTSGELLLCSVEEIKKEF